MEKSRSYFLLFLLIFFKTSLTIITKIDKTTTIIHAGKESLTSFKISLSGVKAIKPNSPKPNIKETVIILFLNILDLNIPHSHLTEIKKNNCNKFKV